MSSQCPHGHQIKSSQDRLPNGYCRECQRDQNRRYRLKQRAALELVRALEAGGVHVDPDTLTLTLTLTTEPTTAPTGVVAQRLVDVHGDGIE